jgi:transketolase
MEPIQLQSKLHGNPSQPLQYSETIQNEAGETLDVACPRATRAMVALMDMQAVLGGAASHYGGPAAFAEIMSATHGLMFAEAQKEGRAWHELFHFINDAGHCENGLYALKANYSLASLDLKALKGFRSIESGLTGHGEAHLFPEGVYISNGPLGSGLPQAQGLAAAESLSQQPRVTITAISDGACMEGEAKEAFAAIPGLAAKSQLGPFICLLSDNNTKLSGRIDQDSFSMQPSFESLQSLGWQVTLVEDGHDLQAVFTSLEKAYKQSKAQPNRPQLIWFKTIKGKGVKSTETSSSGGHGFPLKKATELAAFLQEIYGDQAVPASFMDWCEELQQQTPTPEEAEKWPGDRVKVQKGVSEALIEMFQNNYPIISISADLQGSTGVADFRKKFPQASFEVGVAESNMVSMAIGFSRLGYIPVVDTFAQFGVTKGALPLIMSGLSQGPLIAIYSHTGFQDAADGASHQALTYFAMMSSIPNVDVVALTCADEAKALVSQAVEQFSQQRKKGEVPRSTVFFLGRENYPTCFNKNLNYRLGQPQVVSEQCQEFEKSVALVAAGSLLENGLMAQKRLLAAGIGSLVINPSSINCFNPEFYRKVLSQTKGRILTIEDHRLVGGMGALLAHELALAGIPFEMKSLGIKDHFGRSAYTSDQLYQKYGLGVEDIVATALSF